MKKIKESINNTIDNNIWIFAVIVVGICGISHLLVTYTALGEVFRAMKP